MSETEKAKRPPRKRKPHADSPGAKKKPNADPNREEPRTVKQQTIPDPNRPKIQALDDASEKYVALRDKRMATGVLEGEAAKVVLQLLHHHKISSYVYDGQIVSIEDVEKVKVKKIKEEK